MRFVTYFSEGEARPGVLDAQSGNTVWSLSSKFTSIRQLLEECNTEFDTVAREIASGRLEAAGSLDTLQLGPPVHFPRKMLCVAGNYKEHIVEGGRTLSQEFTQAPWLFSVPPDNVLIGHREQIRLHPKFRKIDYEGELAVVIGRRAKEVSAAEAESVIAGYTIYNDVSERSPFMIEHVDNPRQLSFWYGKSFDTYGPLGPAIVTRDEITDPQDLTIRVLVNGEERQRCNTGLMIFPVYELIEFLTSFLTLEPGDVIATGTPSGVGLATGLFLSPGDRVTVTIDQLGTLENEVALS